MGLGTSGVGLGIRGVGLGTRGVGVEVGPEDAVGDGLGEGVGSAVITTVCSETTVFPARSETRKQILFSPIEYWLKGTAGAVKAVHSRLLSS